MFDVFKRVDKDRLALGALRATRSCGGGPRAAANGLAAPGANGLIPDDAERNHHAIEG